MKRLFVGVVLAGLAAGSSAVAERAQPGSKETQPSCSLPTPASGASSDRKLSDKEVRTVVRYVVDRIAKSDSIPSPAEFLREIKEKTGITVSRGEQGRVQAAIVAELKKDPALMAKLGPDRCQQYSACSLQGDLSGATGPSLEMYEREKAQDGKAPAMRSLPHFEAQDLRGNRVESRELEGQSLLLVQLAGHCDHSIRSIPILKNLHRVYAGKGVRIVGAFVNSGSVADINTWLPRYKPEFDVWVHPTDALGDQIGSHLTPTYLLVDASGRVQSKLVGFKTEQEVRRALDGLLADR